MKLLSILTLLFLASACETGKGTEQAAAAKATSIGHAECAACGMLVHDQPAPRAQVIHSDGTRAFLCSISDLAHYSEVPSPHGKITHTFVEVMEPGADPADPSTQERAWVNAEEASYVVGFSRSGVMGNPVMTYRSTEAAKSAAERLDAEAIPYTHLSARMLNKMTAHEHEH